MILNCGNCGKKHSPETDCDAIRERTYTQSEVDALVAATLEEAAASCENDHKSCKVKRTCHEADAIRIRALIKPDESAALAEREKQIKQEENK